MNRAISEAFVVKSLLVVQYISLYAKLERTLGDIFREEVKKMEHKHKNKLYFMHGGYLSSNFYYNYDEECFTTESGSKNWRFNDEEIFSTLNFNKIIRFDKKEKLIKKFQILIPSIQKPLYNHQFHDLCKKLIDMRNKIAHVFDELDFGDKQIIEQLSKNEIEDKMANFEWLSNYSSESMDDVSIAIFSNLVYMDLIMKEVQ